MSISFVRTRPAGDEADSADSAWPGTAAFCLDWRAARRAERSCCCPAKPRVIAIIPPAAGRAGSADLLLCWHHYRASRQRLAAIGAVLVDIDGTPVADEEWPTTVAEQPGQGGRTRGRSGH